MLYLLMILSTITAAGKSVIFKKIGVDSNTKTQLIRLNSTAFFVSAIIAVAATGFNVLKLINISGFSFMMALLFAFSMIFTYLTQITAMALGTASSTMLIYSCGFLIPIFFGAICYNEAISVIQIVAIVVLLISLFLIINPEKNEKLSLKWLIFSLLSMTGSGTIAILQKIHQRSEFADEFSLLLSWAFIFAGAILMIIATIFSKKENAPKITKKEISVASLSGIFMGLLNLLNLRLAGKIPAVILFPTYNVGSIILSGVLCALMFKEKNSRKQIAGFIIGCIAILFIGLF